MGSIDPFPSKQLKVKLPWRTTPLIESAALSKSAGCRIFLKLDNLQPSGSFKSRGVGNAVLQAALRHRKSSQAYKPLHFYSSSGGNAGLAAVTAATSLGYGSSVVVPETTDAEMVQRIRKAGAREVISVGRSWVDADRHLREVVIPSRERDGGEDGVSEVGVYVPPFDHEEIWEGNAKLVDELEWQMRELVGEDEDEQPDAIVCSVGGGGLFSGVVRGVERAGWWTSTAHQSNVNGTVTANQDHNSTTRSNKDTQILALETRGADSLNSSLVANEHITLPRITSLAKTLGAVRVCSQAYRSAANNPDRVTSVVLSDAQACMGCWRFAEDERILVEPACGVSVALCYNGLLQKLVRGFGPESKVVIVVCGGADGTVKNIAGWRREFEEQALKEMDEMRGGSLEKGNVGVWSGEIESGKMVNGH